MKERARELKAEERANKNRADGEKGPAREDRRDAEPDRGMAKRLHESLKPARQTSRRKPGTGCPPTTRRTRSSASSRAAEKFNARYATWASTTANLDKGAMWPTSFALKELTPADEAKISALVKKAVS